MNVHHAHRLGTQPLSHRPRVRIDALGIERALARLRFDDFGRVAHVPDEMRPRARSGQVVQVAVDAAAEEGSHVHDGAGRHRLELPAGYSGTALNSSAVPFHPALRCSATTVV
jgi:hypothetical protein